MRKLGSPSPAARGTAGVMAIFGLALAHGPVLMFSWWLLVGVPLMWCTGILKRHLTFLIFVVLPIAIGLFAVWGYLIGAAPGEPMGSSWRSGVVFASQTIANIMLFGAILQLALGTIAPSDLPSTFRAWRIQGDALALVMATYSLFPEVALRMNQVLIARRARGLYSDNSPFQRIGQTVSTLRPVLAWALRSALARADQWDQKRLLDRDPFPFRVHDSRVTSAAIIAIASAWVLFWIAAPHVRLWR